MVLWSDGTLLCRRGAFLRGCDDYVSGVIAMGLFTKAKDKVSGESAKPKSKGTVWALGPQDEAAARAMTTLLEVSKERKALEARETLAKGVLARLAEGKWLQHYANGKMCDTPMKLVNEVTGDQVTYVVQNKLGSERASAEVVEALSDLLGKGAMDEVIWEETKFVFDPIIMAQKLKNDPDTTIQTWLEGVLGKAIEEATEQGIISEAHAAALVSAEVQTSFRPGLFESIPRLAGNSLERVKAVLDVLGGKITRYVRP